MPVLQTASQAIRTPQHRRQQRRTGMTTGRKRVLLRTASHTKLRAPSPFRALAEALGHDDDDDKPRTTPAGWGALACHRYRSELAVTAETPHGSRTPLRGCISGARPHAMTIQVREMQENLGHLNEGPGPRTARCFIPHSGGIRRIGPHTTCSKIEADRPLSGGWPRSMSEATPSVEEQKRKKEGARGGTLMHEEKDTGARDWAESGL